MSTLETVSTSLTRPYLGYGAGCCLLSLGADDDFCRGLCVCRLIDLDRYNAGDLVFDCVEVTTFLKTT